MERSAQKFRERESLPALERTDVIMVSIRCVLDEAPMLPIRLEHPPPGRRNKSKQLPWKAPSSVQNALLLKTIPVGEPERAALPLPHYCPRVTASRSSPTT